MTQGITDNAQKTKISFSIIGDAFADLFCLLDYGLPPVGGDTRVTHPMTPVAGGSGVNTATHLSALVKDFSPNEEDTMDVTLQTAINEKDYYGQVIVEHATMNSFEMINCNRHLEKNRDNDNEGKDADQNATEEKEGSTGHCIVMVNEGERSFISHIGVMEAFKASHTVLHELVNCRTADPLYTNHHHHIHVTGYYNLPGFTKGNLKKRLKLVREKRRSQSHSFHTFTTTISLTPQYDATEKWDGGLVEDVLPLVDFLILNALEAGKLSKIEVDEKECGGDINRTIVFQKWADFFWGKSPLTHVIITLGKIGAICLYQGEVVASMSSPKIYENPIDPTGAGDSFSAGFLFGTMNWRRQYGHDECAEIGSLLKGSWEKAITEGMRYGCSVGTACVARTGASVPAPKHEIAAFLNGEDGDTSTGVEESFDDSEDESYEDDSSYESDEYYTSSDGEDDAESLDQGAKKEEV